MHGSTCRDKANYYLCDCQSGYIGDICQIGKIVMMSRQYKYYLYNTNKIIIPVIFQNTRSNITCKIIRDYK